ncbi:UDP-N-acetylmuramoyl-L-alanyl-D-glutamate--L-lysine ligase [Vagococcus intermedius]|uniref:UDP-N-acetylmuramyl-tripeptide synthetase n=1 Tax=Vagococcus intermedius TaxID=2991418 RepID=A0AAF0I8L6_9ENTE|nr:UDP-N-acetylmuramoyl-L-alanyl-D-glutamate--L-lysine ligase [Vagococcus intermedius]WEG74279.1 UDP-N-acetylmuramoyl-L-alanyl-D-glutamate--L-lysine ligase [Vagococcus intermedius]WEG76361.1 UDP-N-acetylmuramoyl-L-alanyl-D-glutamate--L-lysine ligase [Vagococcus intermedius]
MISLNKITEILIEHKLLKEIVISDEWYYNLPENVKTKSVAHITYDSRQIEKGSLFFCKGLAFKGLYLEQAIEKGADFYISEKFYDISTEAVGIIVTDVKRAMAVVSMAFYGYPQHDLKIIAYTGTKGKTTAAYFCKYILDEATDNKTALLSTMETVLDGKTPIKSLLTTPESVDLYRMMRQAVSNGMSHLVMEVSSQAYKTERVYNLKFDVGIFLNISEDHIGAIEHPDFDDYFYCKRELLKNSKQIILNENSDFYNILKETSKSFTDKVISYSDESKEADYQFISGEKGAFLVRSLNDELALNGDYQINLMGDFNQGNALSAMIATALTGADKNDMSKGLAIAKVPGRMEKTVSNKGVHVYIDYAHNYLSLHTLLSFVRKEHASSKLYVVIGSTGGKGVSRRHDFGKVLSELADVAILTTDDPGNERPEDIIAEIKAHLSTKVEDIIIIDRKEAITKAMELANEDDVVVLAGKGSDLYQIIDGNRLPYAGDFKIVEQLIESGY